jgi:hypothetical protein
MPKSRRAPQRRQVLGRLLKATIALVAVVSVFVLAPDAAAHETQHTSVFSPSISAGVNAAAETVSLAPRPAEWRAAEADDPVADGLPPCQCGDGCCCSKSLHCDSCCGAIGTPETSLHPFVPQRQRSLSIARSELGIAPSPADPPPRAST